jgi:hypothetical protein
MNAADLASEVNGWNKYRKILKKVFLDARAAAKSGMDDVPFSSSDISTAQAALNLSGGNPYDFKYNSKGRGGLDAAIVETAPVGMEWRIVSISKGNYVFRLSPAGSNIFELNSMKPVPILDCAPAIVERYALTDEQALLARIRYNSLIGIFSGKVVYSLQTHWTTSDPGGSGQIEVDEIYIGLGEDGRHFSIPVEAKRRGKSEKITSDQILSNYRLCLSKMPETNVLPLAAKQIDEHTVALLEFNVELTTETVSLKREIHYIFSRNPEHSKNPMPILELGAAKS